MSMLTAEELIAQLVKPEWKDIAALICTAAEWQERVRCAKIAEGEADFAMKTYEGARLHDFLSVSRHIEAQIMMRPHVRDKMRGVSYPSKANGDKDE